MLLSVPSFETAYEETILGVGSPVVGHPAGIGIMIFHVLERPSKHETSRGTSATCSHSGVIVGSPNQQGFLRLGV